MQIRNKIVQLYNLLKEYFLMPFCFSVFIISIAVYAFGLKLGSMNSPYFFYIMLASGFFTFFLWFKKLDGGNKTRQIILEFLLPPFLLSVMLIAVLNFNFIVKLDPLLAKDVNYVLLLFIFFTGLIIYHSNQNKIELQISKNKNDEDEAEKIRYSKFAKKFTVINKVPIINYLTKWFYGEGLSYSISLFLIILTGLWLRLRFISSLFFWVDESNTMMVAQRIAQGLGQTWISGLFYARGIIYHHYLALLIKYVSNNLYFIGRAANIPFFIIIIFTIYYFSKYAINKKIGIVAAIIFSFSWISISIFRDARFYEMWLAFFLVFLSLIYFLINEYTISKESTFVFLKEKKYLLLITFVLGAVSYDCQELTAILLYPLIILGVLIFLFKNKIKGLYVTLSSFLILFLALFYKYQSTVLSHLIRQDEPDWKSLYPNTSITAIWNFLLVNQYQYLILVILTAVLILIVFRKKLVVLFLTSFLASWYLVIAYQGYEVSQIRYYYPLLPILGILIAYCFMILFSLFKGRKIQSFIVLGLLAALIVFSLFSGFQESNSVLTNSSRNIFKNDNFKDELLFIKSNVDIEQSTIITSNIWSIPYFLYFNKTPDYIILDSKILKFDKDKIDPQTNKKELDYSNLLDIKKPLYIIINYPSQRTSQESFNKLNQIGKEVFKNGNVRIFLIK